MAASDQRLKEVTIYTDGGAEPNPGTGGYGVVLRFGAHEKELSGGFRSTTNNRMELMAVIAGLEALKEPCRVKLHSDSQYIVNAIQNGAAFRWRANGWNMQRGSSKKAKNPDLWERLLAAYERHEVEFVWVKGHAGIADNERCDVLATEARLQPDLPLDVGFVDTNASATAAEPRELTPARATVVHNEKMTYAGQACRKCGTAVVQKTPKKRESKPGQAYYYAWYLFCPACKTMYMVDEAKVYVKSK